MWMWNQLYCGTAVGLSWVRQTCDKGSMAVCESALPSTLCPIGSAWLFDRFRISLLG